MAEQSIIVKFTIDIGQCKTVGQLITGLGGNFTGFNDLVSYYYR
jgi:hypothetical protein